jgi:hypothetical protein
VKGNKYKNHKIKDKLQNLNEMCHRKIKSKTNNKSKPDTKEEVRKQRMISWLYCNTSAS